MNWENVKLALVFGGSFDPPHVAHVELPGRVRQRVGADVVLYVPAARSPHKADRDPTPAKHRLAMLRLALADQPAARILTDELDRAGDGRPSYTVETLERLRERLPDHVELRLLIGADQARTFETWREPERIVALAEPLVMVRPPDTAESLLASLADGASRRAWADRLVDVPRIEASSTEVRRRVRGGEPIDGLVPAAVARYIEDHGLYR